MSKLRSIQLCNLPKSSELVVRIKAASTGAYRLRVSVTREMPGVAEPVEIELDDAAMKLADVLLDLQRFTGENMAAVAAKALDAGAGKST